jgi:hypothetical protein
MTAKANTVANIRRQIIALERQISDLVKVSTPEHALRLRRASDLPDRRARGCTLSVALTGTEDPRPPVGPYNGGPPVNST